jgi:hypothetical protein
MTAGAQGLSSAWKHPRAGLRPGRGDRANRSVHRSSVVEPKAWLFGRF